MTGVTHSRALGAEDAEQFAAFDKPRRHSGAVRLDLAALHEQRRNLHRYAMLEKRGTAKRAHYEKQLAELTRKALRLECGL